MTSQLFESSSLEEALAEVRERFGPKAKIVRAEKVRRGGIGGFFAKESFVLAVEGPDDLEVVTEFPAASAFSELLAASYEAAADERPAAYSLEALADLADSADLAGRPLTDDLTANLDTDPLTAPLPSVPTVSTETPMFGEVLRAVSVGSDVESALDYVLPPGPRWTGPTLDAQLTYERNVLAHQPIPAQPAAIEPPAPMAFEAPVEVPGTPWWQLLSDASDQVTGRAADELLGSAFIDELAAPVAVEPPAIEEPAPLVEDPEAVALGIMRTALGPALLPGSVIAVVGHPADATTVAARVAVAAGADPFSIHFASADAEARTVSGLPVGRQVGSLDEAILRSRRWPSRPAPVVLVVDGRDARWARTVLDAVEVTTVVALPSPQDDESAVRGWVAALGGVQALLVDDSCRATAESLALQGIPALRSPWELSR